MLIATFFNMEDDVIPVVMATATTPTNSRVARCVNCHIGGGS